MSFGDWHGIHIYYAGNRRPMLTECVRPLVDDLRGDGLLAGYFFINYWLEGPHLRLRLRPSTVEATGEVLRRAEAAIQTFLRQRPALYELSAGAFSDMYDKMFGFEFSDDERLEYVDEHGVMRMEKNNTYKYVPYEPEFGKYGGAAGVAVAEWHFEYSSDLVIEATRTLNLHLRRATLGLAVQLMMVMTTVFLDDEDSITTFLEDYAEYWRRTFDGVVPIDGTSVHDKAYEMMGDRVTRRFLELRTVCAEGRAKDLPGLLGGWHAHCVDLRDRIAALAARAELLLRDWNGEPAAVTDVPDALRRVLWAYLHMTNNRLSVTLADESYLGHVLTRALRDRHLVEAPR
ncbi:lantibiotic dehydratase C-terminal domain-containing protein [Virgisporangium aurantiacum]|uniref:Lantibiotic biosynthesis protein n=1 Tax=Virgisporangium aurantiacum TaxID=175570 RepID=A0A8J4DZU0_9ACTN|nr:lantibiotic dehydratase C-terminal domain-containing protein [Virgisporangium aurantiacum]GIJ56051.1 lantibiotic biosynthesis protein [Virgisporangium aurantiacum]